MGYVIHGMYKSPEYGSWRAAKNRCFNPRHMAYERYGGRGITMCAEWDASFEAFYAHIGPRPSPAENYSLDRIDVDGHYEPGNVRWATVSEQNYNRRASAICRNKLHEMTPENTVYDAGSRRCRECRNAPRRTGTPDPQPCGTPAAYQRHRRAGEPVCDECREAYNARRRKAGTSSRTRLGR